MGTHAVRIWAAALACAITLACVAPLRPGAESLNAEVPPLGRLPRHTLPLHYQLDLEIFPERDVFSGRATLSLELTRALDALWLHGEGLVVSEVRVELPSGARVAGRWEEAGAGGVAAVRLPHSIGPGRATLRIAYTAAFDRQLRGLYRVEHDGAAYAFTQFQPLSARKAFPCFDEPSFKTPYEVALTVRAEHVAVANTPVSRRARTAEGHERVEFARTRPLPSYLVAFAVGPLDVREGPPLEARQAGSGPIRFRGLAARGRAGELSYALEQTPPILGALERYFDAPYPYRKLDVIAVPDFAAGAMENVGAVTFRDSLLLLDAEHASEQQRRALLYVMAHELAHMWFGNSVTMPWWDDLWLNEALATWLGHRVVREVAPEHESDLALLERVVGAMQADSLASARSIRQPIESNHDVHSAFDGITYRKGAAVLAMFERWLGPETFQAGIQRYVAQHRDANAQTRDLLAALSLAASRDVAKPMRSFLDQPGVPQLDTQLVCDPSRVALRVSQARYAPLGSAFRREQSWRIPVCVRFEAAGQLGESCALIEGVAGEVPLDASTCPDWVMPNAGGAGYYRFAPSALDLARLRRHGLPQLRSVERYALADSLTAAFHSGSMAVEDVIAVLTPLAADPNRSVATAPIRLLWTLRNDLIDPAALPGFRRFVVELYAARFAKLGWDPMPGESGEARILRRELLGTLALLGRDPDVRTEAVRRGLRYAGIGRQNPDPEALDPDLVEIALRVAVQERGRPVFEALVDQVFSSTSGRDRGQRLRALGATRDSELAARARRLSLDPSLRVNEVVQPLRAQAEQPETRRALWDFVTLHFESLVDRLGSRGAAALPWLASGLCSRADAERVHAFLEVRAERLDGGPRNAAGSVESIRQCAALRLAQRAHASAYFAGR